MQRLSHQNNQDQLYPAVAGAAHALELLVAVEGRTKGPDGELATLVRMEDGTPGAAAAGVVQILDTQLRPLVSSMLSPPCMPYLAFFPCILNLNFYGSTPPLIPSLDPHFFAFVGPFILLRDAVDWRSAPTTRWYLKGHNHSPFHTLTKRARCRKGLCSAPVYAPVRGAWGQSIVEKQEFWGEKKYSKTDTGVNSSIKCGNDSVVRS